MAETAENLDNRFSGDGQNEDEQQVLEDNPDIRAEIRKAFKEMDDVENRRGECNADADAIRARMEAKGVTRKGFNAAYQRYKLDPEKRTAHDFTFALCCNANDIGYQADLFDAGPEEALRLLEAAGVDGAALKHVEALKKHFKLT